MKRLFIVVLILVFSVSCGGVSTRESAAPIGSSPLITFVFDDGNDTDYLVARAIFAEQGAVACSAITTDWINRPGHLTAEQIVGLRDAGWEIMSHTVSHPKLTSLDAAQIEGEFSGSKTVLDSMGVPVRNVVYPKNMSNELVRTIARKYYRSGRGGAYAVNTPDTDPYYLKSYSIKHDLPGMERSIDRAYAGRSWIIFYQHEIDIKAGLIEREGKFIPGEMLHFSPSGAVGRCESPAWYQYFGSLYFVPISGTPLEGDRISGQNSSATARIERILYDDRAQLRDMIQYVRTRHPDMRIVTIDQGLDILGIAQQAHVSEKTRATSTVSSNHEMNRIWKP
jgi:peptidoglycan/xylan/chitin deacetylase (PgdA/CDA1 family)